MITTINEFRKIFENVETEIANLQSAIKQKEAILNDTENYPSTHGETELMEERIAEMKKKLEELKNNIHKEDSLHESNDEPKYKCSGCGEIKLDGGIDTECGYCGEHSSRQVYENVSTKDWDRMTKLYQTNGNYGDYEHISKSIKDKKKAIARFVAGLKLAASNGLNYDESRNKFTGEFKEFGNRALQLGATVEEIQTVFDNAVVPGENDNKTSGEYIKAKKLDDRFVGTISRAILDAGFDINYIRTNGNAITQVGRDAMNNGRKWTIGYKAEILKDGVKVMDLVFDAITDEGDGPTSYVFNHSWNKIGKLELIKTILKKLNDNNN